MSTKRQHCEHCGQPLAAASRFCEWCGKPVSQQQDAPTRPQTPPPPPQDPSSSPPAVPAVGSQPQDAPAPPPPLPPRQDPSSGPLRPPQRPSSGPPQVTPADSQPSKKNPILIIALIAGGLLLACLLWGLVLLLDGQSEQPTGPADVSSADVVVSDPTLTPGQPAAVAPQLDQAPASVVDDFVKATLGTVPGAAIDYDRARSLMTASYAREFDSPEFVPVAYGFQDGPTAYDIGDEEISGSTAAVTVLGYWGGALGARWGFALQEEDGAWAIAAINRLPTPDVDSPEDAGMTPLELLTGEWELTDEHHGLAGFSLLVEPDGRVRVVTHYLCMTEDWHEDRIYLELNAEDTGRWVGDMVEEEWDPATGETEEYYRDSIVVELSADGQEMAWSSPEVEDRQVAKRVEERSVTLTIVNESDVDVWYLYIADAIGDSGLAEDRDRLDGILWIDESCRMIVSPGVYYVTATDEHDVPLATRYPLEVDGEVMWTITGEE